MFHRLLRFRAEDEGTPLIPHVHPPHSLRSQTLSFFFNLHDDIFQPLSPLFSLYHPFVRGSLVRVDPQLTNPTRVIQLSWRPRAFLYKVFLSDEEYDHLIVLMQAKDKPEKSMVADNESQKSIMSEKQLKEGEYRDATDTLCKLEEVIDANSNSVNFYNLLLDSAMNPLAVMTTQSAEFPGS